MAKNIMVKANGTFKNSVNEILFKKDMGYTVIAETERSYVVLNELSTETMIRKDRMGKDFEYVYTGAYCEGDIVTHHGHECRVLEVWNVEGMNGLTIIPTGDYGFDVDIYEEQL